MENNEVKNKKVHLKTFGCQMNVRDSEVIAGLILQAGYSLVETPQEADVVILNTCSVRQHAEEKVWSEVGRRSKVKGRRKPMIGVVGCMAQNYKEQIFERAPAVDFVVGPSDIAKIPEIVDRLLNGRKIVSSPAYGGAPRNDGVKAGLFDIKVWETGGHLRPEEIYHTGFRQDTDHACVVISEGCSNYCSYCVVPYVRGELRHRPCEEIIREIEEAVAAGISRVTLLGQNVNAYKSPVDFVELLEMVNGIKGLQEFSFITSHPKDTTVKLFEAMARLDKLKKALHLPVQSGSNRILGLMSRGYTREFYLELVRDYRTMVKDGQLTTDIILGFPSESEADLRDTYDLVKDVQFDAAFIFKYSPRPHTSAGRLPDDVSQEQKEKRHRMILDLQKGISSEKMKDKR